MKKRLLLFVLIFGLAFPPSQLIIAYDSSPNENSSITTLDQQPILGRVIANSSPKPPSGERRSVVSLQQIQSANFLPNVPASTWAFGCASTAAAMIAGYYDRTNYPNMYDGPTGSGVFPLTNSIWGTDIISGEVRALNPLSATRDGLDGRSGFGHVDDFWVSFAPGDAEDPYMTGSWTPHTYGECTGDFMKTNQYEYGNDDGWTVFLSYIDGTPTTATDLENNNVHNMDGGYGLMKFYETRGYSVNTMFNQRIYGYSGNPTGFTWGQFKDQIDRGNPVLIGLQDPGSTDGHFMTAIGYDDTGQLMYVHDTWDYDLHVMTWGGSYAGMDHIMVTIIELDPPPVCSTQTHHAITIDGALVDWCRDTEQLEVDTRPAGPIPGDQKLLFVWDSSNFYLAWDGANWDYGSDLWVYFYSRDSQGTTDSVGGAHSLPPDSTGSGADYALLVSGANPPVYTFYDWIGSWTPDPSFTGVISITNDQTEIKIPRVELGMSGTETLSLLAFSEGDGNDESWTSFPTINPIGTSFTHIYEWDITGENIAPNDYNLVGSYPTYIPLVVR